MRIEIHDRDTTLANLLRKHGIPLDMRCDGHGTCGRCRVRLHSGHWLENGVAVEPPAEVLACRTRLVSEAGSVEVPSASCLPSSQGLFADAWQNLAPMPVQDEVVIGIDIGTTTLAAAALGRGRILARETCFNPQARFGDNVMSRISAAEKHLAEMREVLLDALVDMLRKMPPPVRVAITGNSTMTCLFHGVDPASLGHAPFTLPKFEFTPVSGECLGLPASVSIHTLPLISAFLGGDILGGLGEFLLEPGDLFIDIGTNCEMIFRKMDETLVGVAAAAGPAFEGAGISCGTRAVPGAICRYRGASDFEVIPCDDGSVATPIGLCGSAMVDVLAVLRRAGLLSRFGRYAPSCPKKEVAQGIYITEQDIEQLLKAKGAVAAGIRCLEEYCRMPCRRLILAGGFAQFLDLKNAAAIGMLPERSVITVGNTSLASAVRLAAEPALAMKYSSLRQSVSELHLNDIPGFDLKFLEGMLLP